MSDQLLESGKVIRLVKETDITVAFQGPNERRSPDWRAFVPTKKEKASKPVRISVWDRSKTTPAQARLHHAAETAWLLDVETAARIGKRLGRDVLVYREPLLSGNGGDGHCGMEGCDKEKGVINASGKRIELLQSLAMASDEV